MIISTHAITIGHHPNIIQDKSKIFLYTYGWHPTVEREVNSGHDLVHVSRSKKIMSDWYYQMLFGVKRSVTMCCSGNMTVSFKCTLYLYQEVPMATMQQLHML